MTYDPQSNGADPEDLLVRRGTSWESRARLSIQADQAEAAGFGHGVSVTSRESNDALSRDPSDAVEATRKALEDAGLLVRFTPTRKDPDHHTVIFPKPLTEESAEQFNTILGRTRKK
jgi:hypothetical protein